MTHRPPSTGARWRVAFLLDGSHVAAWVEATIATLVDDADTQIVGWLALDPGGRRPPTGRWAAYVRLDDRAFGSRLRALASRAVPATIDRLTADTSVDAARASLIAAEADVVIDLRSVATPIVRGVAPGGTWQLRHGSAGLPGGPLAYLDDVSSGRPAAPTVLVALAAEPEDDRVAYRSVSVVSPVSLRRTRDPSLWKSAHFPIRTLRALERDASGTTVLPEAATAAALEGSRDDARPMRFAPFLARLAGRVIRSGLSHLLRPESWLVATRPRTSAGSPTDLRGFAPIAAVAGHFYADPFVLATADRRYLFVEDWLPETRRGAISAIELDPVGRPVGAPRRALERPYHLSYPFVFEHGGQTYLLPETAGNRTIELYRAIALPDRWELVGSLVRDIRGSDPTIVEHDGRLWLFAAVTMPGANPWDELWLWSSPTVDGPWLPHPTNPVISDPRSARSAGRFIERDGVLYRPAQDCAPIYGRRIIVNRVDELSLTGYRETPVATIEPEGLPGITRTHCIDSGGGIDVIDARRARWRVSRG